MNSLKLNRYRALLLGTKIPENIGSFARLLENFEVGEAGLISPRCEWKSGVAQWMATGHTVERLNALPVYEEMRAAIRECHSVIGFTARAGKTRPLSIKLEDLGKLPGKVALIFGREDICLTDEEIDQCTHLCALDTSPRFPTLNLSHSVAVVLSQLYQQSTQSRRGHRERVSVEQLEPLVDQTREGLISLGYTDQGNPDRVLRTLRRIFYRARLNRSEVSTLRGILTQILRLPPRS